MNYVCYTPSVAYGAQFITYGTENLIRDTWLQLNLLGWTTVYLVYWMRLYSFLFVSLKRCDDTVIHLLCSVYVFMPMYACISLSARMCVCACARV